MMKKMLCAFALESSDALYSMALYDIGCVGSVRLAYAMLNAVEDLETECVWPWAKCLTTAPEHNPPNINYADAIRVTHNADMTYDEFLAMHKKYSMRGVHCTGFLKPEKTESLATYTTPYQDLLAVCYAGVPEEIPPHIEELVNRLIEKSEALR